VPRSKVELYAAIRRDSRAGMSGRALERKYQVGRRTVAKALVSAWPEPRKKLPPRPMRLDAYKPLIDGMLRADLDAPRKQRHTAKRIFDRLVAEHSASQVSYAMVRAYVAGRRPEIWVEAGRGASAVFVPQSHRPGEEAEVDFGDVTVRLRGGQVTCSLFSFRLSYSGKAVHRISASGGQEAFLEGHVHAFQVLGGVPTARSATTTSRPRSPRCWASPRRGWRPTGGSRFGYGFDSFFCQPGLEGAHEKGGVEGDIGWFRRNHLVPVPEVNSLAELNQLVERWDAADDARRIGTRPRTVAEHFAVKQPLLKPLPDEPFETGLQLGLRVDRYSQITVRTNRYSVPVRLIGRRVRVMLGASELMVYDGPQEVARHERLIAKAGVHLELDHYLEPEFRVIPGS
jgi:transposase